MVWVITATENDKKTPCNKGMKIRFKNLKRRLYQNNVF